MTASPARRAALAFCLSFLLLGQGAPALAAQGAGIALSGHVPILCRAELDLAAGSGRLDEFCNDAAGYDVWLDHGPLPAAASLRVDGTDLALSATGTTLISSSDRADMRSRLIVFDGPAGARLVVRMVAR